MTKERKLPFECEVEDYGRDPVEIRNPLSGESINVSPDAAAVYDVIIGSEMVQDWDKVQKGCSWFAKHFPKAYMALLD